MSRIPFFVALIVSVILHEVSHGVVALACGDDTAKRAGRLTLNPIAHIDPFGTLILPAMLLFLHAPVFGFAKPVPVNVSRLRNPRQQTLLVSLAGPATNIGLAILAGLWLRYVVGTVALPGGQIGLTGSGTAANYGVAFGEVNVILAAFNLIPLPPLDGSAILERLMPSHWWPSYLRMRQYSMGILLIVFLAFPGGIFRVILPAIHLWARTLV